MKGFLNRGRDLILPGWRWLYEPLPNSNQPVGLRFSHRAGRYRLMANHRFRPRFVGVVDMYDGRSISDPPQVPLTLRSTNPGLGFHAERRGIDPGGHRFRPRFVGVVEV